MRLIATAMLSLLLTGPCVAADEAAPPAAAASQPAPTEHQRTYHFEHRLIPSWVHKTSGAFYADLRAGQLDRLLNAARDIVSPEFAAGIKVTPYPALDGVLIEYPAPKTAPLCYFTFIHASRKSETGYAVYTYEKTLNFPGADAYGVVGGWSLDGKHSNMGSRTYKDAEAFVQDLKLEKDAAGA